VLPASRTARANPQRVDVVVVVMSFLPELSGAIRRLLRDPAG